MNANKIGILVGSLRKESYNRKLAKALMTLAPPTLKLEIIEISDLSLYNEDLDTKPPVAWTEFREKIKAMDGVLFVTPEYNRSIPGALKNAIDIASRPYGKNVFDQKPGAVISCSVSAMGGFGANHHLRQSLVFLNVPVLQQPEAYIGEGGKLFDEQGNLKNDSTREYLSKFINAYAGWVTKVL